MLSYIFKTFNIPMDFKIWMEKSIKKFKTFVQRLLRAKKI
jgi:hypothetical protein